MTRVSLTLIRHGPTAWNSEGRMQGRRDIPLSDAGRDAVRRWKVPPDLDRHLWVTSPLARARETAALLGHPGARPEATLIETDWGEWEGQRLADLRGRFGDEMVELESRGLDFRPPGGESPRDVQARLRPWLATVAMSGDDQVAVCHKGVMRALFALATGWDMTGPPPLKLDPARAQGFALSPDGRPDLAQPNRPLAP